MVSRILPFIVLVAMACNPSPQRDTPFESGHRVGTNANERLEEASGLAASARYPGSFWSHNDSGHPAGLFLLDSAGRTLAEFRLAGIKNRDCEDIAVGPGPGEGSYIYLGDIGDNYARFPVKYIYRLPEPSLEEARMLHDFDTLIVRLSDKVRDTETLMIDPLTRNLYLVSKREHEVHLYEISYPFLSDTLTANSMTKLPLRQIVAGDISRDGKEVLLKNYDHIYYWKRNGNESVADLLKSPALELVYEREGMGEAIAWAIDGGGFFTLGENSKGSRAPLLFYARRQRNEPDSTLLNPSPRP